MSRPIPKPPYAVDNPGDAIATALTIFAGMAEDVRRIADVATRPAPGYCGHTIPGIGGRTMIVCSLPAGHDGDHASSGASWAAVGQTQVSSRGGETARADDPAGPAKGGTPAGDEPQDVEVASTYGAPSDTGKCPDNSISVSEHAATPTTQLARLREVTEAALVAEATGWHDADALWDALDAMVGGVRADADFIAAFSPDVAYALLVVAEAATAFVDGGRSFIGGPLRDAVDRLAEVTS